MIKLSIPMHNLIKTGIHFMSCVVMLALMVGCGEQREEQTTEAEPPSQITLEQYCLDQSPLIGTFRGAEIFEGGISGLYYLPGTDLEFLLVNDRGPNIVLNDHPLAEGRNIKLFPFPDYTPKIMRAQLSDGNFEIKEVIEIKMPDGETVTGLPVPDLGGPNPEIAWSDLDGTEAGTDEFGIDAEAIAVDARGNWWITEEYRTSIWKLESGSGMALEIFSPVGDHPLIHRIDERFAMRRPNRGFESIAITPDGNIYTMLQSPMWNPDRVAGENSRIIRILQLNPETRETQIYLFETEKAFGDIQQRDWKIGDMAAINNTQFLVIEHATRGDDQGLQINLFDLKNASPLQGEKVDGRTYEQYQNAANLREVGIAVAEKQKLFELTEIGYPASQNKPEGIAILNATTLALINDNDYSIDTDGESWELIDTEVPTCLYIINLSEELRLDHQYK